MEEDNKVVEKGGVEPQETGKTETSWRDSLPEDLRSSHVLAKYDSTEGALKALINAQEYLGRKGVVAPVDGAPQEQIDAYRSARRNGVSTPEAYSLKVKEDVLKGVGIDADELGVIRKQAFAAGLDDDAFNAIVGEVVSERKAVFEAQEQAAKAVEDKLISEWGKEETEKRLTRGRAFIEKFPGLMDEVAKSGLGSSEAFIRFIDDISSKAFGERTLPNIPNRVNANPKEEIAKLRASGVFEKYDHPERQQSIEAYKKNIEVMRQKAAETHGRIVF